MLPLPPDFHSPPPPSYLRPGYYYLLNHYSSSSVRESQFGHRTGDYQHDNARVITETRFYFHLCHSDVCAFNNCFCSGVVSRIGKEQDQKCRELIDLF